MKTFTAIIEWLNIIGYFILMMILQATGHDFPAACALLMFLVSVMLRCYSATENEEKK